MFETREGILKHCSTKNARELGDVGERFLNREQPGLEGQLANIADAIAYNNHDVDDGFRAGLLSHEQLREQALFAAQYEIVHKRYPELEDRRLIYEVIRRMIDTVVTDLIENAKRNIAAAKPQSIDDVRKAPQAMLVLSDEIYEQHVALKRFLSKHLYSHEKKLAMTHRAQAIVRELFAIYKSDIDKMPAEFSARAAPLDDVAQARVVADYIAGMTDRYAIAEHERITG
jgi:dGTPase